VALVDIAETGETQDHQRAMDCVVLAVAVAAAIYMETVGV
jgi:hypothetical protein